jgi:hypothetical protein
MINFRFHLVSLTAVFLALAAGITIGAGVVDRATVDQIDRQLKQVEANRKATRAENDLLSGDLSNWGKFSEQAGDRLVEGRLTGAGMFLIASTGLDRGVVNGFRGTLTSAGANLEGTLWLTGRWNLTDGGDAQKMADLVGGIATARPSDLRDAALARLVAAWQTGDGGAFVTGLRDAGFLEFEAPAQPLAPLAELPVADTTFVVLSGDASDVPAADVATPMVARLAAANLRVLAAQPTRPPSSAKPPAGQPQPPEFVAALRDNSQVASRISTIDNVEDYRGRVAAVLALRDLRDGHTGHYGFAAGVRLLPEPRS